MAFRGRSRDEDEPDEEWSEEWSDGADSGDDDSSVVDCPQCGRGVYEDAPYCPYCDCDLEDHAARPRRRWWVILGLMACVYILYRWITLR
ncbi:MAG TPA: hypothetical protein VEQ85_00580 [Lacipirellulaceae bacterium]|nr:hypothetical protein [Lacipirellulaceae bacterium]